VDKLAEVTGLEAGALEQVMRLLSGAAGIFSLQESVSPIALDRPVTSTGRGLSSGENGSEEAVSGDKDDDCGVESGRTEEA
jgi:hypothetical protein